VPPRRPAASAGGRATRWDRVSQCGARFGVHGPVQRPCRRDRQEPTAQGQLVVRISQWGTRPWSRDRFRAGGAGRPGMIRSKDTMGAGGAGCPIVWDATRCGRHLALPSSRRRRRIEPREFVALERRGGRRVISSSSSAGIVRRRAARSNQSPIWRCARGTGTTVKPDLRTRLCITPRPRAVNGARPRAPAKRNS
jgi:hypothetical protein